MARHKVIHSQDACCILITGDKAQGAEPSTAVIKFPGGHVEVSRCSDGTYWCHLTVQDEQEEADGAVGIPVQSRVGYSYEAGIKHGILSIPDAEQVRQLSLRVATI